MSKIRWADILFLLVICTLPYAFSFFTPGHLQDSHGIALETKTMEATSRIARTARAATNPLIPIQQYSCAPVNSPSCGKYQFNQTAYPFRNFPGHKTFEEAEHAISELFQQIKTCTGVTREEAESIGCAMYIPLCLHSGELLQPCAEDCEQTINGCRIMDIPGYEDALGICTIFPSRISGTCFTHA